MVLHAHRGFRLGGSGAAFDAREDIPDETLPQEPRVGVALVGVADYEYHTNDVKISESGLPSDKERFLSAVAIRALCFIEEAFRSAARFEVSNGLTAVVSIGVGDNYLSHGTTVKFFTQRAGRPAWYEDLERFKIEAIAVLIC